MVWEPVSSVAAMPEAVRFWLLDTGSLTDRIEKACEHFSLTLIGEGHAPVHHSEHERLQSSQPVTVREVLLCNDATPWVYARSVIPDVLMSAEFNQLGDQPLGRRLFNDARFSRGEFEICRTSHPFFAADSGLTLWGRRSVFHFQQHALLVAELFLPASPLYQTDC